MCRRSSKPRSSTSSGNPSSAAAGRQADQLRRARLPPQRLGLPAHRLDDLARAGPRTGPATLVETCATPRVASFTPIARTPGSPPLRSRTLAAIAFATSTSSVSELDVEGDQRRARRRPAPRRRSGAAAAGRSPAPAHPCHARGQRVHAPFAEERALAPVVGARQLPVDEHRQVQLRREPVGDRQRLVLGELAVLLAQVGDRHHVERADARMRALVHTHVDVLDHRARRAPAASRRAPAGRPPA